MILKIFRFSMDWGLLQVLKRLEEGGRGGGVVAYRLYDKMRWFTFFAGPRLVLKSGGKN